MVFFPVMLKPPPIVLGARKVAISIRLRPETLAAYKQTGKGWQTRLTADLDRLVQRRAGKVR